MCNPDHFDDDIKEYERRGLVTRREFGKMAGAGIMMMLPAVLNAVDVTEEQVIVKTADGTADCYWVHPTMGAAPGVLIWTAVGGRGPAIEGMAKRLAETGYSVLVPNPYYRQMKGRVVVPAGVDNTPAARQKYLLTLSQDLTQAGPEKTMSDARAYVAWLDQQPSVAKDKRMATMGYCMGGPLAFRTPVVANRVGAVASFHGGGVPWNNLVMDGANSPHQMVAKTKAQLLVAIADSDDKRAPDEKTVMRETFAKAGVQAEIEVYAAAHGWTQPDSAAYNESEAERAWARMLALYQRAL